MTDTYYVYIMASLSRRIYTGVTNDLHRRVLEHKNGVTAGFTDKYRMRRLVFYEATSRVEDAIAREKQIKGWLRSRKLELTGSLNPKWRDLSLDWGEAFRPDVGRGDSSVRPNQPAASPAPSQ